MQTSPAPLVRIGQTVIVAVACALGMPESVASQQAGIHSGRTYHCERSNTDGTDRERVWVHRLDRTRLEVFKRRERGTGAALVTAQMDSSLTFARAIVGGRLQPENGRLSIGTLTCNANSGRLTADVDAPGFKGHDSTDIGVVPWQLYNFDLASLRFAVRAVPRASSSFELPLVLVRSERGRVLQNLGCADAQFVAEHVLGGRAALRDQARWAGVRRERWTDLVRS